MPPIRRGFGLSTAAVALAIALVSLARAEDSASPIPEALHGVWAVESMEQDGEIAIRPTTDEADVWEVIIQRGRFVMVHDEVQAFHAVLMRNALGEQIRIWDKRGDRARAWIINRLDGEKLTLSIMSDDNGHPPMDFTAEKGANQIVLVLKKAPDPDPSTIKPERIVGFGRP
jgi:hypothetical protein